MSKKSAEKKTATKRTDPVVHFEMPSQDGKRMAKFYTKAFGWETKNLGKEMGDYTLVSTSETDKKGGPKNRGMINGGFYPKTKDMKEAGPSLVIAVENLKKSMKKIEKAGGKVLGEPMKIPGYGTYISFLDTEGNRTSIMAPSMEMKKK
ncbi:MAG: VOC family protein [Bacteroidia bacterium]|nr:VOC family protein [Bacteroidia bacterium]